MRGVSVALSALMILSLSASPADAAPGDGVSRKSIFIDLGARPAWETAGRVQRICNEHRDPNSDSYISNVVLVGVVDPGTQNLRVDQLDAILPHVPGGGDTPCFDNVFVGPTLLNDRTKPWQERADYPVALESWCADSAYCGGILTGSWRWDNIQANRAAADQFLAHVNERYPGVRANLHWYVTYEGYFDWFGDNGYSPLLKSAYQAYLLQIIREFRSALIGAGESEATSSRAILWSPSYEDSYQAHNPAQLDIIRNRLRSMFYNIKVLTAQEGITRDLDWFHMQDRLGQIGCFSANCYDGVRSWYQFLASVNYEDFSFENLRVNMELFAPGSAPLGDPNEHSLRQDFYEANGVPIGASWELQFLIPEAPSPPEVHPPSFVPPRGKVGAPPKEPGPGIPERV
jgi:hypothetical protein